MLASSIRGDARARTVRFLFLDLCVSVITLCFSCMMYDKFDNCFVKSHPCVRAFAFVLISSTCSPDTDPSHLYADPVLWCFSVANFRKIRIDMGNRGGSD